jgi:hypothetical protein
MTRFAIGLALLSTTTAVSAETDFGIRTVSGGSAVVRVGTHVKAAQRDSDTVQARVSEGRASIAPSGKWASLKADTSTQSARTGRSGSMGSVASLGSQWGRVTSTYRTPAHNRRVGGVRNSYHLRGRAIDIARRPGVTHAMIAASFRNAGYRLIESLDEGDHSHFAFAFAGDATRVAMPDKRELTKWGVVTVSTALLR